ncbi:MAG: DegT/DnrJ/EryC1/StrS family aminotransferase [candidate division Zixibacteria bacterium]|nr:DegT/DnrJ/EryC1/StrS family aminotransferase [Candidatus Tariuqbacter arcticus]
MRNLFRKIPTTAVPIYLPEVLRAVIKASDQDAVDHFEKRLAVWLGVSEVVLVNKGTTALYLILKALKRLHPHRDEVIYPDYTVPTLKLAFDQLELKTRVCDISRTTFNMDPRSLSEEITGKTLAVLPVHMFGFPMALDEVFNIAGEDIAVIEDACQAPGARINGEFVGAIAPSSIFSLCKGKNFSTYSGGFAAFNDIELAGFVRAERDKLPEAKSGLKMVVLITLFALAMRPGVYGPLYPFIKRFKSEEVHQHFDAVKFTSIQAALGDILLDKLEMINAQRRTNGLYLYEKLKDCGHILIPEIIDGADPVFNHFPVVFLNENDLKRAQSRLWEKGIDTARMYMRPNHHIYDLGYPSDAFPDSILIAKGLITLPSHPYMNQRDLGIISDIILNP